MPPPSLRSRKSFTQHACVSLSINLVYLKVGLLLECHCDMIMVPILLCQSKRGSEVTCRMKKRRRFMERPLNWLCLTSS